MKQAITNQERLICLISYFLILMAEFCFQPIFFLPVNIVADHTISYLQYNN